MVLSRLEDGRVEAYAKCNRRMLGPAEAAHLTRKPRPTPEPKPKQRARPNCIDDAMIKLVDRLEREQLEKEQQRREQQRREQQKIKEEQASGSVSTAVPRKPEARSRPRARQATPPEPPALPPPPALPMSVAPVQPAPAALPEPTSTASTPPAVTPSAALQPRRWPTQDERIAGALQAFWERNRAA